MRTHDLKCWPEPFAAILDGRKHHEVRTDDRGFAVGDVLELREWLHEPIGCGPWILNGYTGRSVSVRVTYLSAGGTWGLPDGLCVMSIALVTEAT